RDLERDAPLRLPRARAVDAQRRVPGRGPHRSADLLRRGLIPSNARSRSVPRLAQLRVGAGKRPALARVRLPGGYANRRTVSPSIPIPPPGQPLIGGSPFPPIADYSFLSDCHTGGLIAPDGSIEWMCIPRFDSPSVFGTLLDRRAGSFRVGPYGIVVPLSIRYVPGTMVVETTWMTPSGWLIVHDVLTIGPWRAGHSDETSHTRPPTDQDADHMLVRVLECTQGQVQVEAVCEPMFEYGRNPAQWQMDNQEW